MGEPTLGMCSSAHWLLATAGGFWLLATAGFCWRQLPAAYAGSITSCAGSLCLCRRLLAAARTSCRRPRTDSQFQNVHQMFDLHTCWVAVQKHSAALVVLSDPPDWLCVCLRRPSKSVDRHHAQLPHLLQCICSAAYLSMLRCCDVLLVLVLVWRA